MRELRRRKPDPKRTERRIRRRIREPIARRSKTGCPKPRSIRTQARRRRPKAPRRRRPTAPAAIPSRVGLSDLTAVQGLLAVQRLDALAALRSRWPEPDRAAPRQARRPPAARVVLHDPARRAIRSRSCTRREARNFDHLPGKKLTYLGYRDLDKQMRAMLKGVKSIAVEYSPKAAVPNVSRVDAGTVELIRAAGVQVRSSETLVQYTKAIWGDAGRTAHYVAVHHLVELRKEALAFIAKQIRPRAAGHRVRRPAAHHARDDDARARRPAAGRRRGRQHRRSVLRADRREDRADQAGDLIVTRHRREGRQARRHLRRADVVSRSPTRRCPRRSRRRSRRRALARDQALVLITDRSRKHRPVTGAEVDQATRAFFKKAGVVDKVMHRTGHSIDNDLQGGGADLDDFEVKDTRIMTPGTGFTVGPGLYFPGSSACAPRSRCILSPTGPGSHDARAGRRRSAAQVMGANASRSSGADPRRR